MQHRLAFSLVFLTGLAGTPYASAQDSINPAAAPTDPASPNAATALTQDEIAAAIGRLGSPQYEIREEASRLLKRAGAEAIEPLARAAAGENLEVVWRAIRLLERQLDSDDEAAFDAAELALEKLEVSSNRSAARRAAASLETQPGRRWKRALARFEAAGGWGVWRKIEDSGAGFPQPRTEILLPTYLVIPPGWTGGEAALQQVKRMDAALSMESFKPRVYVVDGCGIPQTAIDAMQNSLQQMEFQARGKA
ncbi:MAG: hypothetical protein JSS02_03520, partial [Planctomycetes bacterium]|nr:hypothetical protein [Planctomycetota bacterium]